jgi:hypothetical protein
MADFCIIECDGYPGCDAAHSEAAMADTMVVMLEDTNRVEHMLGDIMLRAWRMRSTVRVVFVKPKFDEIYKRKDSPKCVKLICCMPFADPWNRITQDNTLCAGCVVHDFVTAQVDGTGACL